MCVKGPEFRVATIRGKLGRKNNNFSRSRKSQEKSLIVSEAPAIVKVLEKSGNLFHWEKYPSKSLKNKRQTCIVYIIRHLMEGQ